MRDKYIPRRESVFGKIDLWLLLVGGGTETYIPFLGPAV